MLKIKDGNVKKGLVPALLNAPASPPISPSCRPLPVLQLETQGCTRRKPGPMAGVNPTVAQWRTTHAYLRSRPVLSFHRRLRPVLFPARPGHGGRQPRLPALQYERTGDNSYRISVAVSGFSQAELSIVAKENTLTIKGEKSANENVKDTSEVLYRGIAARAFERASSLPISCW